MRILLIGLFACGALGACDDDSSLSSTNDASSSVGSNVTDAAVTFDASSKFDVPELKSDALIVKIDAATEDAATADASTIDASPPTAVLVNFENVPNMTPGPIVGSVPVAARLSNQLQTAFGVTFASDARPHVALVNLGQNHATSGSGGIGSVSANDAMAYGTVTITFSKPGSPETAATTGFVSIRGDSTAIAGTVTIEAFGIDGVSLGSATANDVAGGLTVSFTKPGIHKITVKQTSNTVGYDDLRFWPLTIPL